MNILSTICSYMHTSEKCTNKFIWIFVAYNWRDRVSILYAYMYMERTKQAVDKICNLSTLRYM